MLPYEPFLNEADSYFKTVSNTVKNKKKLGNKVIFSISTMVIEKYFVSLLMSKDIPVSGHSMRTLIELGKTHFDMPKELSSLEDIDNKLDLCSFDAVTMENVTNEDIDSLYSKLVILKNFVYDAINKPVAV